MKYRSALWDGSDPLYAPNTSKSKSWIYWKPTKRFICVGFPKDPRRLPGIVGDSNELERARLAREYTREMLRFLENPEPKVEPRSWKHLIAHYLHDHDSPFHDLKANTQVEYHRNIDRWERTIGTAHVGDMTYPVARSWLKAMTENGRSVAYQKRQFTMLRILANYGVLIHFEGAEPVSKVLSGMRLKNSKPRSVAPTSAEVEAIIKAADEAGDSIYALGLSLQWWLTLRAVDVRGQWLPGAKGGIAKASSYWADGLTWDMINHDLSELRKTPSKTENALPDVLTFDLTPLPDLRARLAAIPETQRVGPVIRQKNGRPYSRRRWATLFKRYKTAANVPDEIWNMDLRAGAITHAVEVGASQIEVQHQANHSQASTTERYIRKRSRSVNKVIGLRAGRTT